MRIGDPKLDRWIEKRARVLEHARHQLRVLAAALMLAAVALFGLFYETVAERHKDQQPAVKWHYLQYCQPLETSPVSCVSDDGAVMFTPLPPGGCVQMWATTTEMHCGGNIVYAF